MDWKFVWDQIVLIGPWLAGFLMPMIVTFVTRDQGTGKYKIVITLLSCFVGAALFNVKELAGGDWTSAGGVLSVLSIYMTEATALYHLWYKDSKVEGKIVDYVSTAPTQ